VSDWLWGRRRPPSVPGAAARRRVDLTFIAAVVVTATVRNEAVRTGATIALGTGGAAYLLLAYRRQPLEAVDTRERRITEFYIKAVEQFGQTIPR
jgi:hypothetical protein